MFVHFILKTGLRVLLKWEFTVLGCEKDVYLDFGKYNLGS